MPLGLTKVLLALLDTTIGRVIIQKSAQDCGYIEARNWGVIAQGNKDFMRKETYAQEL